MASNTMSNEYHDTLKLLADKNCLVYDYALSETIRLMENLVGHTNEDRKVIEFASKAARYLSDYEWNHYNSSTIAQLELFLHAMSSVLHVLSQSVEMIDTDTRASMYKSVSKFWTIYRNTNFINANVMFRLREIRTWLRKIKDDQSYFSIAAATGSRIVETIISVVQNEYMSAVASVTNILDFEYSAGIWHDDWKEMNENYYTLRRQSLGKNFDLTKIKKFSRHLLKLSKKEFERVKRKNTNYRNLEYKTLKLGGGVLGYSLPDNIDTLLIGYLHIIQQIIEEFNPQIKKYIKEIIPFCNEIINTHVKKQLTFKAAEVLYVIKETTKREDFKNGIESNFKNWSNLSIPVTISLRPLSCYSTPDTPASFPLSQGEKRNRRPSLPKKIKTTLSNPQKDPQKQRKEIIEAVKKLFEERRKIRKNINEIRMEYTRLLNSNTIDENSILSKLNEILEERRRESERRDRNEYLRSLEHHDESLSSKLREMLDEGYTNITKVNTDDADNANVAKKNIDDKENTDDADNDNVAENIDADKCDVAEENIDDADNDNVAENIDDADNDNVAENIDADKCDVAEENINDADNADVATDDEENIGDADNANAAKENIDDEENTDDADKCNANVAENIDADKCDVAEENINDADNADVATDHEENTYDADNGNVVEVGDEERNPSIIITDDDERLSALKELLPSPYDEYSVDTLKTILPSDYSKLDDIAIIKYLQNNNIQDNNEYDDEKLNVLKESLPSPYNEYDVNKLKTILPSDYNKLDNTTIINYVINIQNNDVQNSNLQNNIQDNNSTEDSTFLTTFRKIVKEVENIVEKAQLAHQAAVNNERIRRLSNQNVPSPVLSEKEKETLRESGVI